MTAMVALSLDYSLEAKPRSVSMETASRRKADMFYGNDPKLFGEAVANFLATKHPTKTAASVAADTGCSIHQIEKWIEGASAPAGLAMLRLIAAYGPEFIAAVMQPRLRWIDEALNREIEADLLAEIDAANARLKALRAAR